MLQLECQTHWKLNKEKLKQREGLRKLTEEQKKRIKDAIDKKVNEHLKKGTTVENCAKVVIPEMIAVAIEEYHKIFNER